MNLNRKFGFLLIGRDTTISVPATFDNEETARTEAVHMATASDKIVLVENRTAEIRELLLSEGDDVAWLR